MTVLQWVVGLHFTFTVAILAKLFEVIWKCQARILSTATCRPDFMIRSMNLRKCLCFPIDLLQLSTDWSSDPSCRIPPTPSAYWPTWKRGITVDLRASEFSGFASKGPFWVKTRTPLSTNRRRHWFQLSLVQFFCKAVVRTAKSSFQSKVVSVKNKKNYCRNYSQPNEVRRFVRSLILAEKVFFRIISLNLRLKSAIIHWNNCE